MKIQVREAGGKGFTIPLPNFMLFSPTVLQFAMNMGKKYASSSMPDIPPETLQALSKAVKQINKKYGTWELVHVESADGDTVIISI